MNQRFDPYIAGMLAFMAAVLFAAGAFFGYFACLIGI